METPKLTINPELRDLLPPLSDEELAGLEAAIKRDGCTDPLTVWGDILVDGHHRHAICTKHDLQYKIVQKKFDSLVDAKIWMCERQDNRRNLTLYQRGVIALKMKPVLAEKAKQNQKQSKGHGKKGLSNLTNLNTRYLLSERFKISAGTLHMVEFLEVYASEEIKRNLRADKTSISGEYKRLKAELDARQPAKPKKTKPSATSSSTKTTSTPATTKTASSPDLFSADTSDKVVNEQPAKCPTEIAPIWKGVKEQQHYCCGVRFEPDPDDDFFDWITREEREELRKMQEKCPAVKLVPLIRNYTIQSIPEHDPEYLVACLFSLFQPLYRKKLLLALVRKMFAKGETESVREAITTLKNEFQL